MRVLLLNSAIMPHGRGIYDSEILTLDEFISEVRRAHQDGTLKSYISYQQNIKPLEDACGIPIDFCQDEIRCMDRDVLLVARLKYLPSRDRRDPILPSINSFEFRRVRFRSRLGLVGDKEIQQ